MSQLAMRSDGNHAFAANAADLQRLFDSELGDVMSVCAKTVVVQIDFGPGVKPLRALNREVEINGRSASFNLNQVYSKQEKYVLFEVAMDAGTAGSALDAVVATARYKHRDGTAAEPVKASGRIAFTAAPAEVEAREDKAVQVAVAESIATENARVAIQLRDEGKVNEAKQRLQQNSTYIEQQAARLGSKKLQKIGVTNRLNEANVDNDQKWNATRKQMRKDEHEITTQQSY
jgi:Ca-activated chloride channel family protein